MITEVLFNLKYRPHPMLAKQPTSATQLQGQALRGAPCVARLDAGAHGCWYSAMAAWGWGLSLLQVFALFAADVYLQAVERLFQLVPGIPQAESGTPLKS